MNEWLKETQILNPDKEKTLVMLHGFIGSPYDLKPLAEVLKAKDYRIVLPFLPVPKGEGENTLDAAKQVVEEYSPSALVGFSMGGALSILLSKYVSRVVLLAPYLGLPMGDQAATKGAYLLRKVIANIPKFSSGRIACKKGLERYEPRAYSFETASFLALQEIALRARGCSVEVPCLWAHAPKDPVASYKRAEKKLAAHSEHLLLPDAHHVLLYDYGHSTLIERAVGFFKE